MDGEAPPLGFQGFCAFSAFALSDLFLSRDATMVIRSTPMMMTRDQTTGKSCRNSSFMDTNSRMTPRPYLRYLMDSMPPWMTKNRDLRPMTAKMFEV